MRRIILAAFIAIALGISATTAVHAAWDHDPGDSWGWFACCYW